MPCPAGPISVASISSPIAPGLWQGALRHVKGCPVDFSDIDLAVVLAPDARATVVHPYSVTYPLKDEASDLYSAPVLRRMAAEIASYWRQGSGARVGIFCSWGLNRSGLVTALVLRRAYRMTGADAMRVVKERREGALGNVWFERYLAALPSPA